ncbi:inorganic pyrophosphatase [bacterium]|nr:inorganic pyrophosphatase [bacterium]
MENLWRQLVTGPNAPELIYAIVEIPKGSRNKYEYHKEHGVLFLDRVLYSSLHYPGDYGLIPRTFCEDGDPLDVLVMVTEPTFPGCVIRARPIGIFRMLDRGEEDFKILAVADNDPLHGEYHDIKDIPQHYLDEVRHFFQVYKDLEGSSVEVIGWEDVKAAKAEIQRSQKLYKERFGFKDI